MGGKREDSHGAPLAEETHLNEALKALAHATDAPEPAVVERGNDPEPQLVREAQGNGRAAERGGRDAGVLVVVGGHDGAVP